VVAQRIMVTMGWSKGWGGYRYGLIGTNGSEDYYLCILLCNEHSSPLPISVHISMPASSLAPSRRDSIRIST
jgi:hypothetical protein